MSARLIDGKGFALRLRERIAEEVAARREAVVPGLAAVLVGEDPASDIYVRNKGKAMRKAGMNSWEHRLPAATSEDELLALIDRLNRDPAVHGILVQMPLPDHITAQSVIEAVAPDKDVDGFHPVNVGRLGSGVDTLVPCTPLGARMLLAHYAGDLSGLSALVIGRSNIVGKPMASLLLAANCTVTVAHSRTGDLAAECRRADILVAAIGRAETVRGDWIKPGATVIDVGINRIPQPDGTARLVGDVAFDEAVAVAGAITPVPGGVGPMTIACLLWNTMVAACRQEGVGPPEIPRIEMP